MRYRTKALRKVAAVIMADPTARFYGYDLARAAHICSPVVYPMLTRMLEDGWVIDGWEFQGGGSRKRPPRRYYLLTQLGQSELAAVTAAPAS